MSYPPRLGDQGLEKKVKITIKNKDGKYSEIRDGGIPKEFPSSFGKSDKPQIRILSSTAPQPYVGLNFDASGNFVGGRTLTQGDMDRLIEMAEKSGMEVVRG